VAMDREVAEGKSSDNVVFECLWWLLSLMLELILECGLGKMAAGSRDHVTELMTPNSMGRAAAGGDGGRG
jgi:hypothetical protein